LFLFLPSLASQIRYQLLEIFSEKSSQEYIISQHFLHHLASKISTLPASHPCFDNFAQLFLVALNNGYIENGDFLLNKKKRREEKRREEKRKEMKRKEKKRKEKKKNREKAKRK